MEVFVSLDLMGYNNKPSRKEIIEIKQRTAHNHLHIELSELAHEVGNLGVAFIPGILSGGLKSENCVGMQLFALDFDGGISFNEIKTRCDDYGLPIAFAYHTFSSTPEKEKFRIVFVHEYYIYDAYVVKIMLAMLHIIFPECDGACKNPDRLFLGGKELFYLNNDARFSMVQLPPILYRIWSKNRHLAEKSRNFCNKHNIMMINGSMAIGLTENLSIPEEISASMDRANIHIIGESTNAQISILECKALHPTKTRTHNLTRLNISENINCQLLQDFNNGAELGHQSKFLILTNLKFINGGVKHFFNILKQVENDKDTIKKWEYDFKATISNYNPAGCSTDYCPYYSICNNDTNILATLRQDHKITCKQQCNYVKVEEAYESMRQNLLKAHNSHEPGIHLIQAQTALGKTGAYIRLIAENTDKKFIVALPTNILKMQVYNDLLTKVGLSPNEIFITASIRDPLVLLPQKIINRVVYFHNCGLHNMQADIISEHYNQIKDDPQRTAEANQCIRLLSGIELFKDERVIVTTHAKFLQMPKNSLDEYTIIIDENILYLQIMSHIRTISIETLKQLKNCKIKYFSAIAEKILSANEGEYIKLKPAPYAAPLTEEQLKHFGLRCNAPKLKPIFQEMTDTCYYLTDSLNENQSLIRNTFYRLESATDFICSKGMQQEYMAYEENFLTDRYRKLEQITETNDMEQHKTDNAANAN